MNAAASCLRAKSSALGPARSKRKRRHFVAWTSKSPSACRCRTLHASLSALLTRSGVRPPNKFPAGGRPRVCSTAPVTSTPDRQATLSGNQTGIIMSFLVTTVVITIIVPIAVVLASVVVAQIAALRNTKTFDQPDTQDDFTVSIARWGKVQERIDQ